MIYKQSDLEYFNNFKSYCKLTNEIEYLFIILIHNFFSFRIR